MEKVVPTICASWLQEYNLIKDVHLAKQATYTMFNSKPFRESLSIPDKIWNKSEPMIKDKIIAIRVDIRKKNESSQPKQAIPSQYPTMAKETMLNLVSSM